MKKINLKNYIVLFISTAIATFAIYLDNNIYNASFDQYIYSLIKVSGMNGTKVVSVVLIILYGFLLFSLLSAIFILPTINFGRKVSINIKKNKANWNEYGVNIPNKENSKCPETTSIIANAFNIFILSENIFSIHKIIS